MIENDEKHEKDRINKEKALLLSGQKSSFFKKYATSALLLMFFAFFYTLVVDLKNGYEEERAKNAFLIHEAEQAALREKKRIAALEAQIGLFENRELLNNVSDEDMALAALLVKAITQGQLSEIILTTRVYVGDDPEFAQEAFSGIQLLLGENPISEIVSCNNTKIDGFYQEGYTLISSTLIAKIPGGQCGHSFYSATYIYNPTYISNPN